MCTCRPATLWLLVGMASVIACSERTEPDSAPPPVTFGFINGPQSPGNSGIFRGEDFFFAVIADFEAGLVAVIGLENTIAELCSEEGEFDLAALQLKPHEFGEVNSLITMQDAPVQVFAIPDNPQGFCTDLAGAPVLYSGTASLQRTDNNFTETGTEGGRANSFGWSAQGVLTDLVNGGEVHFSGVRRFLISPQDEFRQVLSKLTITR